MGNNFYPMLSDGMKFIMDGSNNCIVKLINYTIDSNDYDDVITQTLTGSYLTSGLIFPVRGKQGSEEAILMEQGKLQTQDKVLFLTGSVQLNSSGLLIGIGTSPTDYYTIISNGITTYEINGSPVYKKIYLRYTIPGSIF